MDNANLADAFPCAYCKKLIWPSRGPNGEIYCICEDCMEEEKQNPTEDSAHAKWLKDNT